MSKEKKKEIGKDEEIKISERNEGIKTESKNVDGMVALEDKKIEEKFKIPNFFISGSKRYKIALDILFNKEDGNILSIIKANIGVDYSKLSFLGKSQICFEFSCPSYEDICFYRQRSTTYNQQYKLSLIDNVLMRQHYIKWHLKDWSVSDEDGKKIELKFEGEDNKCLTLDSQKLVFSLAPALIDIALTNFEKDVLLT